MFSDWRVAEKRLLGVMADYLRKPELPPRLGAKELQGGEVGVRLSLPARIAAAG